MDKEELKTNLQAFVQECQNSGYPVSQICLVDAYSGDSNTPYILEVKANWVDNMDCSKAISILASILFKSASIDVRKKLFAIKVLDSKSQVHCVVPGEQV